jgi:glycosyltransferase involved in cell wall biosynthesis
MGPREPDPPQLPAGPAPGKPIVAQCCTIVASNYLAQARVLVDSLRRYHPEWPFAILVIDDAGSQEIDGVQLLSLSEIGLEDGDEFRMPMIYNVTELSTAVKPWLLRRLLAVAGIPVIYFDPDIEIFAPLDDIAGLAEKYSIVLTPHVTEPMPRDKLKLTESDILGSGIYNLGFIAIGPGSERFLDWWSIRLRRESVVDPERMRFTDQRWIDFVPGMFSHFILRDPACNVAYWNLYSRQVEWSGRGYEVNGAPLRFFHFSGYDPDKPHLLSKHQGNEPRILLSEHPGVGRICREYSAKLRAHGFERTKGNSYRFDRLENGLRIDRYIHTLYREALVKFEEQAGPEPPSPFRSGGQEAFVAWLNEPLRTSPIITRYMYGIHCGRIDLQHAFPDPLGKDAPFFFKWYVKHGQIEVRAHPLLVPEPGQDTHRASAENDQPTPEPSPAVNVVGYLRAELGVGEAARLLISALEAADIPYNTIVNRETINRQTHSFRERTEQSRSDINIVCVNADQTPVFARKMTPNFFAGRHTAAVWFWEVEDIAPELYGAFNFVDEIWVASDFILKAFAKISPKPIFKFNLPILKPVTDDSLSRSDVGLPDRFTFLFSFDFMSVLERKNPFAIIEAFRRAFRPHEGPALVIKTINGDKRMLDLEKLRFAAQVHPDIRVVDGYVSPVEKNTMMALCDCYVSLHRSEGYGLTMAEAMGLGKPVIATGYSGNLDFMTAENSYLCSYIFREIGPESPPYPATSRWAEPNLDEAAAYMRHVYENPDEAEQRGKFAADQIARLHSPAAAGITLRQRIDAIRADRFAAHPNGSAIPAAKMQPQDLSPDKTATNLHALLKNR